MKDNNGFAYGIVAGAVVLGYLIIRWVIINVIPWLYEGGFPILAVIIGVVAIGLIVLLIAIRDS